MAEQQGKPPLVRWASGKRQKPTAQAPQHTTNGQPSAPASDRAVLMEQTLLCSLAADKMAGQLFEGLNEIRRLLGQPQVSQGQFLERCFLGGLQLAHRELERQQLEHGRRVLTPEELRHMGVRMPWD